MPLKFRVQGEQLEPVPYLTETEESLFFKHGTKNIQSDPRDYLKQLEKEKMTEEWKSKAPKQATWFSKHPTQILKQSKRVWKWSVEVRKGKAWLLYFCNRPQIIDSTILPRTN